MALCVWTSRGRMAVSVILCGTSSQAQVKFTKNNTRLERAIEILFIYSSGGLKEAVFCVSSDRKLNFKSQWSNFTFQYFPPISPTCKKFFFTIYLFFPSSNVNLLPNGLSSIPFLKFLFCRLFSGKEAEKLWRTPGRGSCCRRPGRAGESLTLLMSSPRALCRHSVFK